ncbi:MAG: ATP synthase F1 subunit delta [Chloroflexi bacterium]|nr:ATP synthase F1 subunit delta [Chloroflexota bacterium]
MNRTPEAYARGILAAVLEPWLDGLEKVNVAVHTNKKLRAQLYDPNLDIAAKLAALDGVLPSSAPKELRNFLGVLLDNNDIGLLDDVEEALARIYRGEGAGPQRAIVTTALPLSEEEKERVRARLSEQFGSLEFVFQVDPDILGGIIVRVGDTLIDDSVRGRLEALRQNLGVSASA